MEHRSLELADTDANNEWSEMFSSNNTKVFYMQIVPDQYSGIFLEQKVKYLSNYVPPQWSSG
jgi:hypothetical protein